MPVTLRPDTAPTGGRTLLRDSAFLRLWCGTTASGLATWAMPFILGLAVLDRSLDPTGLGIVLATRTVGFLVAVPVGGVLADRHSRRAVVFWSGVAAALATPLIAAGLGRSVALMAVAAAVVGAGQGACRPAFQALTAEVVDAGRRQPANAAITFAVRGTTLLAPALTVLLAVVATIPVLLLGTAALWAVAALSPPAGTHRTVPAATNTRRFRAEFVDGIREARRHPWFLAGLAALTAVIATGYSATGVALPVISRDRYGTEIVLAAATTAYTVGALAGALTLARWQPHRPGWTALAGLACYGFAPLSLLLPAHQFAVVAAYTLAGIGIELFNVPWFTAIQREMDPRALARVSSLDFLVSYGLAPAGLALIAPAIAAFGPTPVLATCAAVCFLAPTLAALTHGAAHFTRPPRAVRHDSGTEQL
ncbi:MFS transporter [Micromonospora sp. WMMD1082]|uniref:MFS transporter n=1 Tax=Micromonospora sp. WMMD1082 TaxID=3016104 RepID=UPI0024174103|nr:MFS transporter [Micromonospora sp. WMMD1082]MDG4795573.1 MFS transporter [Micromonospora sp. WMMD1082]